MANIEETIQWVGNNYQQLYAFLAPLPNVYLFTDCKNLIIKVRSNQYFVSCGSFIVKSRDGTIKIVCDSPHSIISLESHSRNILQNN